MESKINFFQKNIIINFDCVSNYANSIKDKISTKIDFDWYPVNGNDIDINIYKSFCKKYNNIIIIGSSEEKNNTICIKKIISYDIKIKNINQILLNINN